MTPPVDTIKNLYATVLLNGVSTEYSLYVGKAGTELPVTSNKITYQPCMSPIERSINPEA